MSPRLGVGHEAEHAVRDGLGAVGHGGTVDDLRYFRRTAVVVATGGTVGMVVIVGVTMVYAAAKTRRGNLIDALKQETL